MPKDISKVLARVQDEARRKQLEELASSDPVILEALLAKEDYSRQSDELRAEREKMQEQVSRAKQWDEWYSYHFGNTDPNELPREYQKLRAGFVKTGDANPSNAAATVAGATTQSVNALEGLDFSDPEKALPEAVKRIREGLVNELRGQFISREAMEREFQARLASQQQAQDQKLGTAVAMQDRVAELRRKYEQDFGEAPPPGFSEQIYQTINQFKYQNPEDAYNRVTSEKYRAKADTDLQAKIKAAEDAGYQRRLKEEQTHSTPDGSGGNGGFASPFNLEPQKPEIDLAEVAEKAGHEFGDGYASRTALGKMFEEDLRSGKFGPLQ